MLFLINFLSGISVICIRMTPAHQCGTVYALVLGCPQVVSAPWATTVPRGPQPLYLVMQDSTVKLQDLPYLQVFI